MRQFNAFLSSLEVKVICFGICRETQGVFSALHSKVGLDEAKLCTAVSSSGSWGSWTKSVRKI